MLEIKGLDEFQRKMADLAQRAKAFSGSHSVPLPELLTPEFLSKCSRFLSADEMFETSGFKIDSMEDFKAIPDAEWDNFIRANTSFDSWDAMLGKAVKDYTAQQLGL